MRYSIVEAAALLGISERTLYRCIKRGVIQVEKEGEMKSLLGREVECEQRGREEKEHIGFLGGEDQD